jgi:glycine/betaine/sarcosine/D-proline reductase family selenoprotein B
MVGLNRILSGTVIPNPYGNAELPPEREKELRRKYIQRALNLLQQDIQDPTVFTLEGVAP